MGNLDKTIRYLKRNGFVNTYYAVTERLFYKDVPFHATQQEIYLEKLDESISFSILVPVYETKEEYLRDMIDSCLSQIYGDFELILADASKTDGPKNIIESYTDDRIKYVRVEENKGISENTNVALLAATKEYCALLDHDDLLTPDALYEMAAAITRARLKDIEPNMVYSDEDKCNTTGDRLYDRHFKQKLNLDLLLSNNYICHFTVIKTDLLKKLKFRSEYNGSQDHDLFLRVVGASNPDSILYIGKVLYHWRCHEDSTAFNPASKEYAYTAGKAAIKDFIKNKYGVDVPVKDLSHKGFYMPEWGDNLFAIRKDVGAVGHFVAHGRKITSGIIHEDLTEDFQGMNVHYTGYRHRACLNQDVFALDLRTITPSEEMRPVYERLIKEHREFAAKGAKKEDIELNAKRLGIEFGQALKEKGLLLLLEPTIEYI